MYYYIVNPAAGGGRINKIQERLKTLLKQKGIDGEFVKSTGRGEASKIAKVAVRQGATTIVAVGGDSTVSEVINGVVGTNKVVLGMLPIGVTNILARALGIADWTQGVNVLAQRRVKIIDLGKINDIFFATSLDIGFETEVLKDRQSSSLWKPVVFKKKVLDKILSYKPFSATIKFDSKFSIETNIFNLSVFNTRLSKGEGDFKNDGKLTAVLVSSQSKFSLLKNFSKIATANYEEIPFVSKFRAKKIFVEGGKVARDVFADAGYVGITPIEVSVSSKKLKVIVSKDRKFD